MARDPIDYTAVLAVISAAPDPAAALRAFVEQEREAARAEGEEKGRDELYDSVSAARVERAIRAREECAERYGLRKGAASAPSNGP